MASDKPKNNSLGREDRSPIRE
jgi:hypothetical protein